MKAQSRFHWACGLSYDGSPFCGWQVQSHGAGPGQTRAPSIQACVESSISALALATVRVRCAGRTDAGVHALNQVITFSVPVDRPAGTWVRGVNARLPGQIAVRWARPVDAAFDARFDARSRSYRYLLIDSPVAPPVWDGRAGWTHRPLDVSRMQEAARALVGEHDFSAFRAAQCQARTPVRDVHSIRIWRSGAFVVFDFTANAFLHHMIRNLVGTFVMVGDGRRPPAWPAEVLASRDRGLCAPTFSAAGLYFMGVRYDDSLALPSLAPEGGLEVMV